MLRVLILDLAHVQASLLARVVEVQWERESSMEGECVCRRQGGVRYGSCIAVCWRKVRRIEGL